MAALSLSELRKRPGRIETLVSKLKLKEPLLTVSNKKIVCDALIANQELYTIDDRNYAKVVDMIRNSKINNNVQLRVLGGGLVKLTELLKSADFGGAGASASGATRGNRGDMAEAIFASAIVARFVHKNTPVTSIRVHDILDKIQSTKQQQTIAFKSKNVNDSIQDDVIFILGLAIANLKALQDKGIRDSLEDVVQSSIKYANSKIVSDWAKLLYENNVYNLIEVIADGIGDQTGTKVDVRLKVDSIPTNINVSLKAGDVKQFGQVGGSGFDKQEYLWEKLCGLKLTHIKNGYEELRVNKKPEKALELAYKTAADEFNRNYRSKKDSILNSFSEGILFFSTLHEESVTLVQLNKSDAKIYNFGKLKSILTSENIELEAVYHGTKSWPEFHIVDKKNPNNILLVVRTKAENKSNGEIYIRNYVEKGPLMGKLVAKYAD